MDNQDKEYFHQGSSEEEFIDFGIPMTELNEILNAAELQEEWCISQPIWNMESFISNDNTVSSENNKEGIRPEVLPVAGPSGFQNNKKRNHSEMFGDGMPSVAADDLNMRKNIDDAIIMNEKSRRPNKKYSAEEITYEARVNLDLLPQTAQNALLVTVVSTVKTLFDTLLRKTTWNLAPQDLIRYCFMFQRLDKPISTCLMRVDKVTVEMLLSKIMKVLQSKDEILLDENFKIDVITIQRPVGGARQRRFLNVSVDRLDKKSVLSVESDDDFNVCCAKSIILAKAYLEKNADLKTLMKKDCSLLLRQALALHAATCVPEEECGFTEIAIFEAHLDLQIVVISTKNMLQVEYKGPTRSNRINLLLHDGHYDVITSLKGFYGSDSYCMECELPYNMKSHHMCDALCYVCRSSTCVSGQQVDCTDCDRTCRSPTCYEEHKRTRLCDQVYQCKLCYKVIRREDCSKEQHKCGTKRCPSCKNFVDMTSHRCFLEKSTPIPSNDQLLFFDFETDQSSGEHVVNYAVAQYADGRVFTFQSDSSQDACSKFCTFLLTNKHKNFTVIAHNMKGFDGQFILGWMLSQGFAPEIIPNGSKIMSIKINNLNLRIIDSFNFLPMRLSNLPKTFGFEELKKGYFPHLFNRPENQDYIGELPDRDYYSPDTMSTSDRNTFLEWYEERKASLFNFREEMDTYCRSDVDILRRCCLEFRSQFLDVAGVDPFCYVTIASACMATYRARHIVPNTIAMVPIHGYVNSMNYSRDSIRWMNYVAYKENIIIRHALNGEGEVKLGKHFVDGFCESTKSVYQYHGCLYHGCLKCYDAATQNPFTGTPMKILREKTANTTSTLRSMGYKVTEMWEHDFVSSKKNDRNLIAFLTNHDVQDRLNPRDAFFGGRTNAIRLFYEGTAKYVDFTSLYPWTNKYCKYPLGHPVVITENFKDIETYFGFIKCKILPPRKLFHPVLPSRIDGKLLFPLCRRCAENMAQNACTHTDEERALVGTWVTEEVKKAIEKGYEIKKVYEVYHFNQSSNELFKSYINLFLKIKQEASGWPSHCESPEDKDRYIKEYLANEGIALDPSVISFNPGRRQVAKLALNSFWGRWGMNVNKTKMKYISTLIEYNNMLSDTKKEIIDLYLPTPEIAAFQWRQKNDFLEQEASTNIFLAAFTTTYARLKLYHEIDRLGISVLYMDTDSIIYSSDGINDPPLGDYLGQFTDELGGEVIKTFVSGGPKNYAYETSTGITVCKVRGFSLNFENSKCLNYHTMKDLVMNLDQAMTIPLYNTMKITRDIKRRRVLNKDERKLYKMVYTKRYICENYNTLPYGY